MCVCLYVYAHASLCLSGSVGLAYVCVGRGGIADTRNEVKQFRDEVGRTLAAMVPVLGHSLVQMLHAELRAAMAVPQPSWQVRIPAAPCRQRDRRTQQETEREREACSTVWRCGGMWSK
jgi:hypothetical protein